MNKVIGTVTTYHGSEFGCLRRSRAVLITGVYKYVEHPDYDEDAADEDDVSELGGYITDDGVLARCGGITKYDRVEVQPWVEREGRYSFVTSDPLAVDLACFAHLTETES
ncbi:hypothetical protein [Haliangium ochraceum]|uniref:Uncharacterized protein n=1 Tax=Haliangium ochraceum (strain DSM 14365 / JCM 11303 / SMP-2) TaxID=502025 RepID=D0LN33_HALO1|nr:hypothetical protein [Haliangium ochraceum]ACY13404.1 conserved hypothetical protein [Haliangium ochraceum DSM 14365]